MGVGTITGVIGVLVMVGGGLVIVFVDDGTWVGLVGNSVAKDELAHAKPPSVKKIATVSLTNNLPIRNAQKLLLGQNISIRQT